MIRYAITFWALICASSAQAAIDIQQVTSPAGITAWVVPDDSIPFVAVEILFRGGAALDLPDKRGATYLMTALLEEGAGDLDAQAFQTQREGLAARFQFDAGDDTIAVSAQFLVENQDQALALLRKALSVPRFDAAALERVRAQVLAGIASDAKDPDTMAASAFYAAAFGDHPYGTAVEGSAASVAALGVDDLRDAHRRALTRDRVYVAVVGDIALDAVGAMLDDLLGDLPATGPDAPPDAAYDLAGGVSVIPYDVPQSVAFFGHQGLPRDHPDFFAAFIINHVLGAGGFESRLMQEVRDKRGLTYGIRTGLVPKFHADLLVGTVASSNETIAQAIAVTRDEWDRLARDGMDAAELARAKTYLTGEYPLRFDSNAAIAGIMVGMQITGLSPDYVINRNDYINAVTLDDINRVAASLLRAQDLHFVVVGQPSGLDSAP